MPQINDPVFAALADSTRRELLIKLVESSKTATQLAREFPITRQGILKHLDVLAEAGLVHAQAQGREKRYSATLTPLHQVSQWIESVGAKWEERLGRLKNLVENDKP